MKPQSLILRTVLILALAAAWILLPGASAVRAATCTWDGSTGNWSDTGHWTGCGGAAPDSDDIAVLNSGTVTLDSDVTVQGLVIPGPGILEGSSSITVTQVMTWTGGQMRGAGTTTIAPGAGLNLGGATIKYLNTRTLENQSTAIMTGTGSFWLENGAIFSNTGSFDLQIDEFITGVGTFNNAGTFRKSGGSGLGSVNVVLNNSGMVEVQSGALRLQQDGAHSGTFDVSAGAILEFDSSDHTLDASATVVGAGDVTFSGGTTTITGTITGLSGLLTLSSGTLNLNSPTSIPAFSLPGPGIMGGSSSVTVTEVMTWTGGTMGGAGTTTIAPGADLNLGGATIKYLNTRTLENQGTAIMTGTSSFWLQNGATFSNTGMFHLQVDESITGIGAFNNAGTFRKSGDGGMSIVNVVLNNGGTVEVQSGTLRLQQDGAHSGTFDVSAGATLQFYNGDHTLDGSATIAGAGDVTVSGGSANFGDAASIACGSLNHSAGTLILGDVSIAGNFARSGGIFDAGLSTVTFDGGTAQNLELNAATAFHNLVVASGTTLVETVAADNATVGGELINQGVIRKTLSVFGTGAKTFGLTGAALDVTIQGALASVQVDQVGVGHPNADPEIAGGRYWAITPDAPGYTVDLTLPHTGVPTDVQVCRYTGSDWDCAQSSASATTVTREGITQLSDWAVGDTSREVDLALDKAAAPTSLRAGERLTYTLTVENQGTLTATGVTISDTLHPSLTYVSATPSQGLCAEAGGVVSCTLGAVPPPTPLVSSTFGTDAEGWTTYADADDPVYAASGGSPGGHVCATDQNTGQTWYFQAPARFHGDLSAAYGQLLTFNLKQSVATSQFDDPDVILIGGSGLTLGFDTSYNPETAWTLYRVSLHESGWVNTGTSQPATQGEMLSVLSDLIALRIRGEFYTGVDTGCLDNVMLYGPADAVTVRLVVMPTAAGLITNTAGVTANEIDLDLGDNVAQESVLVLTPDSTDLSVNKSASPDPVTAGDLLTYTVTVVNASLVDATGVILTDTLPQSVTFGSAASSQGDCGETGTLLMPTNTFVCHLGALNSGDTAIVTLAVTVDPAATGRIANTAAVTSTETDSQTSNNAVTITTTVARPAPKPLAGVVLLGPTQGYAGIAYVFTAIITPAGATEPITYTWSPPPAAGAGTAVAIYTWSVPGLYPITAWAAGAGKTVSDTHTVAISPPPAPGSGDAYEDDDTCGAASSILTDGTAQVHTFHDRDDDDWVTFAATAGITTVVEARVPPTSTADVTLELYDACGGDIQDDQDATFSPDVRLVFRAPASGPYYLRLSNGDPALYGAQTAYHLSVRAFETAPASGALVLVAGRLREDDPLQANIHHVTTATYQLARANGCAPEQIYYLATDPTLDADGDGHADVAALPSRANLEQAITQWAAGKVGPDQPFTLYLMDHGGYDSFYLDGQDETVTPEELDGWLADLEGTTGVQANVIVEACRSGSFIDPTQTASENGRLVIASTGPYAAAYASQVGAAFSDALLNALGQDMGLGMAFEEARWAAWQAHPDQTPWLDGNGNGVPNETDDWQEAAQHAFACAGVPQSEDWSPHIVQVNVTGVGDGMVEIWAQVQDDVRVKWAWAVVYPPSYPALEPGEEFETEPLPVTLQPRGYDWYGGLHIPFEEFGEYRIVVYAQDEDGLDARPKEFRLQVGGRRLYLPVVLRQ